MLVARGDILGLGQGRLRFLGEFVQVHGSKGFNLARSVPLANRLSRWPTVPKKHLLPQRAIVDRARRGLRRAS
jgi:hypothetical protein